MRTTALMSAVMMLSIPAQAQRAEAEPGDSVGTGNAALLSMQSCECSAGTELSRSRGVIYNCRCGTLDCAVVGSIRADADSSGHHLVCK